eukprot:15363779-Ditylum_brightwellii.AAC.1
MNRSVEALQDLNRSESFAQNTQNSVGVRRFCTSPKTGIVQKTHNIGECVHRTMLRRSAWKRTPEKKAKDIASSETAPRGGSDVDEKEA